MLEARRHHRRQQPVGLAVGLGEQEGHQRELGDVELELSNHALERGIGNLYVRELERGPFLEELRDGVVAEERLHSSGPSTYFSPFSARLFRMS